MEASIWKKTTKCCACPVRRDGICAGLDDGEVNMLGQFKSADRHFAAGQEILEIGHSSHEFFNLQDGWAFRYVILENGRRQILDFLLPGAVIGFQPGPDARSTHGVQALTDARACAIRHRNLPAIVRKIPGVGLRIAQMMAADRRLAYDHLASVGCQIAYQRVAHLLLELFLRARFRWPGERSDQMLIPLTQEHIGDALGLTPVHVNRVLRDLRADGIVDFHYRRLNILDPDNLMEAAETDPHLLLSWMSGGNARVDDPILDKFRACTDEDTEGNEAVGCFCC